MRRTFGTVGRLKATPQTEVIPSALKLSLVDPFAHVSNVGPEYLLPESQGDGILKGRVDTSVGGGQHVAHMSPSPGRQPARKHALRASAFPLALSPSAN